MKNNAVQHEVTLVWKDGGKCQAHVPELADEVTCGTSRFRRDKKEWYPTYVEVTDEAKRG